MRLVGAENAAAEVDRLWNLRSGIISAYLAQDKDLPAGAINIRDRLETDTIPAGGTPAFLVLFAERASTAQAAPEGSPRSAD